MYNSAFAVHTMPTPRTRRCHVTHGHTRNMFKVVTSAKRLLVPQIFAHVGLVECHDALGLQLAHLHEQRSDVDDKISGVGVREFPRCDGVRRVVLKAATIASVCIVPI